ncbi:MAG TPA: hypothetical protein PKD83_02895 [Ignavibacteria bacterium]|nr:hypothetical protein [Ignavibacteria bacterium]
MSTLTVKNYIYITSACIGTYLFYTIFEYIYTSGQMGVPLDDTWIHFQFADNFSKGNFFQFNAGEYTAGTTSPFYVIVLGLFSFITGNFIFNSIFLSAIFHFLSCIFIYKISLIIFGNKNSPLSELISAILTPQFVSLIIALLTVLNGRFAWSSLSGMETTMFTFFTILSVYFHIENLRLNKFNLLPALFLALSTVSRPEGFLLFGLYLFDVILNLILQKELKQNFIKLVLSVLIFLIITLPYLIFSYKISGHFFPNTFRGQGGEFHLIPNFEYILISITYFLKDNLITGILYIVSVLYYFKNIKKYYSEFKYLNLIFLWIILLPLISSVLIPNWRHHVRYLIPLIPFINLISVYVFFNLLDLNFFSKLKAFLLRRKSAFAFILIFSIFNYVVFGIALGMNTDNINDQQVKLAGWVYENVGRNEVIAVNDIGAIGFINKNRIIDVAGLITPEILRFRTYSKDDNLDSVNYLLKKNNVSYIIIYDEWFRDYLEKYGNELIFQTSSVLENNTICGGNEMKIYKTNFNSIK